MRAIGLAVISGIAVVSTLAWSQEQVQFTGNTTANAQLIHDAMQPIALYVRDTLGCSRLQQVEAELLPPESIKRDASSPEGNADATYELWTVTSCGERHPFLVVFWTDPRGGTMFRVQLRDADS